MGLIEDSANFNIIIKKLSDGMSYRKLSSYLKNNHNEDISPSTLGNYWRANKDKHKNEYNKELARQHQETKNKKKKENKVIKSAAKEKAEKDISNREAEQEITRMRASATKELYDMGMNPEENTDTRIRALDKFLNQTGDQEINLNINNGLSDMFCENDILRFINESETNE